MAACRSWKFLKHLQPPVGQLRRHWAIDTTGGSLRCSWMHSSAVKWSLSTSEALSLDGADQDSTARESSNEKESFAELFRSSKFTKVLDPVGKKVEANVFAVVGDNMYVDFGCKFHAVVPLPKEQQDAYKKGSKVVVLVKDLEMTDHFIGDSRDTSLLEAEVELVLPK